MDVELPLLLKPARDNNERRRKEAKLKTGKA